MQYKAPCCYDFSVINENNHIVLSYDLDALAKHAKPIRPFCNELCNLVLCDRF